MSLPPNLDRDKLSEAALAILALTAFGHHETIRAWEGIRLGSARPAVREGLDSGPEGQGQVGGAHRPGRPAGRGVLGETLRKVNRCYRDLSSPLRP